VLDCHRQYIYVDVDTGGYNKRWFQLLDLRSVTTTTTTTVDIIGCCILYRTIHIYAIS